MLGKNLVLICFIISFNMLYSQSNITIQNGASITLTGNDSYICADEIYVESGGTFSTPTPSHCCIQPTGDGDISLPVVLCNFEADIQDGTIVLQWITQSEIGNLGFEILRSENGVDYFLIASYKTSVELKGAGNSSTKIEYNFIDRNIQNGHTYWYKLTSFDISGQKETYGSVRIVYSKKYPKEFVLHQNYPNPFNHHTNISVEIPLIDNNSLINTDISIYNITGQKIATIFKGMLASGKKHSFSWAADGFVSGIYFIKIITPKFESSKKMVLLK